MASLGSGSVAGGEPEGRLQVGTCRKRQISVGKPKSLALGALAFGGSF